MIGLSGSRVIVLDDVPEEAQPIMSALAKRGIPTAFFDASKSPERIFPTPENRLKGVRLAILDMDLFGGGISANSKAAGLAKYVGRIISPENGPYGIIAWTRHSELIALFENYIYKSDIPNPIFTIRIEKTEFSADSSDNIIDSLYTRLDQELSKISPLLMFETWEGGCFDASTSVTNALARYAISDTIDLASWRSNWVSGMLELLRAIALAQDEQHLSVATCATALFAALNPLHADRMDSTSEEVCSNLGQVAAEIMASTGKPGIEGVGQVNSMMHLTFQGVNRLNAGNLYRFNKRSSKHRMVPSWVPKVSDVLADCLNPEGKTDQEKKESNRHTVNSCWPVVIEISASCDHAQKKLRMARLLSGVLVPADKIKRINSKAAFIKTIGPLFVNANGIPNGTYYLCFNAKHVVTLKLVELEGVSAFARLRSQVLADIQSWFAYQVSRQGVIMLK